MNATDWPAVISNLTPKQFEVFSAICCNQDQGHHPKTIASLLAKGLIEERKQVLPGRFPVTVKRYEFASYAIHIAWCEICAALPDIEDDGGEA